MGYVFIPRAKGRPIIVTANYENLLHSGYSLGLSEAKLNDEAMLCLNSN